MHSIPDENFYGPRRARLRVLKDLLKGDKEALVEVLTDLMHLADQLDADWVEVERASEKLYVSDWREFRQEGVVMTYATRNERVRAAVARVRSEILQDIASGQVPASVSSWGELDSEVDGNTYGGACDDDGPDSPTRFSSHQDWLDFWEEVQDIVHIWLQLGRPGEGE